MNFLLNLIKKDVKLNENDNEEIKDDNFDQELRNYNPDEFDEIDESQGKINDSKNNKYISILKDKINNPRLMQMLQNDMKQFNFNTTGLIVNDIDKTKDEENDVKN